MPTKRLQERYNGSKNDTVMPPRRASRGCLPTLIISLLSMAGTASSTGLLSSLELSCTQVCSSGSQLAWKMKDFIVMNSNHRAGTTSHSHYQSSLDAVYVYAVPWLEFPIVSSFPHYPHARYPASSSLLRARLELSDTNVSVQARSWLGD